MAIITRIIGRLHDMHLTGRIDPLELTSEERASTHFAAETMSGRQLRVSLPRGTELQDGDVLSLDDDCAVVVKAKDEDLLLIRPGSDDVTWWAACYQLGNFHRPARFSADGILTPSDPMAEQMLRRLDIKVEKVRSPFVGRRFGAAGAHHHDHGDDQHEPHAHGHAAHHHGH